MHHYMKIPTSPSPDQQHRPEPFPSKGPFRPTRKWTSLAAALSLLAALALLSSTSSSFHSRLLSLPWPASSTTSATSSHYASKHLAQGLPLKPEDMAILLKTGSGMRPRLETHLRHELGPGSPFAASLQIYSDYEHDVLGHHVVDSLKDLNATAMHPEEWDLYQQHKKDLDSGLSEEELDLQSGQHWFDGGRAGDNYSRSWGIDKYKFIPILIDAARRFPAAKWFVFMDDDALFMLESLRRWLAHLDWEGQLVFGERGKKHPEVNLTKWANGKGFVLSKGFVDATFRRYSDFLLDEVRDGKWKDSCCGDRELWRTLSHIPNPKTLLTSEASNDIFKNDGKPERVRFDKHSWCRPKLISHKLEPEDMERLLALERQTGSSLAPNQLILNAHVFDAFAPAALQEALHSPSQEATYSAEHWTVEGFDADRGDAEEHTSTEQECQAACLDRKSCMTSFWSPPPADADAGEGGRCQMFKGWLMGRSLGAPVVPAVTDGPVPVTTWRMDRLRNALKDQWCH